MSDNISQIQEVDVLKKKLALLIKGLKEEKKLLLKKTKEEYQELLQLKTSPEKLSTYFNTLENQENCEGPDIEKFKLRKESTEFKNKINTLEEDNKKLLEEIEKIKKTRN